MAENFVSMVESARKGRAPFVAVPLAGELPFTVRRDLLVNSLKGLDVVDAGLQLHLETGKPDMLVVYAKGKNVQAIRKFRPVERNHYLLEQWAWAEAQRIKRAQPKVKLSARDKLIAKYEKQLAKLGKPRAPKHPLLETHHDTEWRREHDARELRAAEELRANGSIITGPITLGQQWAQWKREAHIRRWIQLQARECQAGKITTTQLYRILNERGLTVRKWSELHKHDKDRCEDLRGYLNTLWKFCRLTHKPEYWFEPMEPETMGPQLYAGWLEWLHEYKELASTIAGLKEIEPKEIPSQSVQ